MPSYSSNVSGIWQFNRTLEEETANHTFSSIDGSEAEYIQFQEFNLLNGTNVTKNGLKFNSGANLGGQAFQVHGPIVFSSDSNGTDFEIAFTWFSPGPVGYTRHLISRNQTTMVAPILAKATFAEGSSFSAVGTGEFIISEVAASTTQNKIRFELCANGGIPTHVFESAPYDPGIRKVFISVDSGEKGVTSQVAGKHTIVFLLIDGKADKFYADFIGDLENRNVPLQLNSVFHGYTTHKKIQEGAFIADLVIKRSTGGIWYTFDAIKVFRLGWQSITETDQLNNSYNFFGIGYKQPSTVTTNQIYVEGGDIYAARSNGEILRGKRPIWDNEFDFKSESNVLSDNIDNIEHTNFGLQIKGTTAKI